jgi:hypothetical protein
MLPSLRSQGNNSGSDNILPPLGWVAGIFERLTLQFEGSTASHLELDLPNFRIFTALKHMELVGGFVLTPPTPVSDFKPPNLESLAIAVSGTSLKLILGDEVGKVSAIKGLRQCFCHGLESLLPQHAVVPHLG